ncbi:hypothetical protein M569_01762 [Genlisea aurea]|uniref:Uncharacterized protein n=1 Tax=Genlisea aurea TaxID=192259 RepID=S8D6G1_9LAMI|nr:hypothetical protein M569_01762 [Genlisea aurea]
MESVKKMMLIHEQVFKEQVHELHRLYGLQKVLMQKQRMESLRFISPWQNAAAPPEMGGYKLCSFMPSCSGDDDSRMRIVLDLESLQDPNKSRNDDEEEEESDDVEVELTLSIGQCTRKQRNGKNRIIRDYQPNLC